MIESTTLHIRLASGVITPRPGQAAVNELSGGPETLLHWLEVQIGLPLSDIHHASRVTEYAAALDAVTDSTVEASMGADRWATASELLSRRDELRLAGWDEVDSDTLPDVVRDLARAAKSRSLTFLGEAERRQRVLNALDAGGAQFAWGDGHVSFMAESVDRVVYRGIGRHTRKTWSRCLTLVAIPSILALARANSGRRLVLEFLSASSLAPWISF